MKLSKTLQTLAEGYKQDHMLVLRTVIYDSPDTVNYCLRAHVLYNEYTL